MECSSGTQTNFVSLHKFIWFFLKTAILLFGMNKMKRHKRDYLLVF